MALEGAGQGAAGGARVGWGAAVGGAGHHLTEAAQDGTLPDITATEGVTAGRQAMGALVWDWDLGSCWVTHCHGQVWVMDTAMVTTIMREVEVGHTTPRGERTSTEEMLEQMNKSQYFC